MPKQKSPSPAKSTQITIGRDVMVKINAVEGIKQSVRSAKMFREFDARGLSQEERRQAILAVHGKKG